MTYYIPLAKPTISPRTNYMPLQNLKEHPRTDYMPCNTCVPYYYLIIFRSSHPHMEKNTYTHNTTLTSTTMGGPTWHHVGKDLNTYINDHGRNNLPPCRKGICVSPSSRLITSTWKEPRSEVHQDFSEVFKLHFGHF